MKSPLVLKKQWDPRSDWDLDSLNQELDSLQPFVQALHDPSPSSKSFNAKGVVAVVRFSKAGFRMGLDDDSSSDEENVEPPSKITQERELEVPRGVELTMKSPPAKPLPAPDQQLQFLIAGTTAAEAALQEMERKQKALVLEKLRQRREELRAKFEQARREEATALDRLQLKESENMRRLHEVDMRDLRAVAELRDLHLAKVQRDHEQRAQVEKQLLRNMAAAEEARSAKARAEKEAKERAEAEAKREAERKVAEAKRQAQERERREAEERSKVEQRAKLEAEAKAKAKAEELARLQSQAAVGRTASQPSSAAIQTTGGGPSTAPRLKVSERAAEMEKQLMAKLADVRSQSQPFEADESRKKERKMLERKLILHVQQISATQQQVGKKSRELIELLRDPRQPQAFLVLTFASKLLSQCEVQIQKLPQFAFALAQVTVNVAMQVPLVMDILVAELHKVCIYTVPKHFVFTQNTLNSDEEYYSLLGYRVEDGKLETTDSYIGRMIGYVTFYAAITQTDVGGGQNPHGLPNAWAWCASLLRRLPPNRATASTLEAFLKVAGFRLHQTYRKPFEKLLAAILHEFVGALKEQNNADTRAAVSRIQTYAQTMRYSQPPDGRDMAMSDDSSRIRA